MNRGLLIALGIVLIVSLVALVLIFDMGRRSPEVITSITNFEECAKAGNPVTESFPRQCRTNDGFLFIEPSTFMTASTTAAMATTTATTTAAEATTSAEVQSSINN